MSRWAGLLPGIHVPQFRLRRLQQVRSSGWRRITALPPVSPSRASSSGKNRAGKRQGLPRTPMPQAAMAPGAAARSPPGPPRLPPEPGLVGHLEQHAAAGGQGGEPQADGAADPQVRPVFSTAAKPIAPPGPAPPGTGSLRHRRRRPGGRPPAPAGKGASPGFASSLFPNRRAFPPPSPRSQRPVPTRAPSPSSMEYNKKRGAQRPRCLEVE